MILSCKVPYNLPSMFSVNIDDILVFDLWRISPCDFQVKLRDVLDIEVEDLLFKNQRLYKRTPSKIYILKEIPQGFLKDGYKKVINFLKQLDFRPTTRESFLQKFSKSVNLTNIFQTFGEPHFHSGTSEGYDLLVYFGTHMCSVYKKKHNGVLVFVVGISGNISAYSLIMSKCKCYFHNINPSRTDEIYIKSKKSEFI
jgi:hypothetical protein